MKQLACLLLILGCLTTAGHAQIRVIALPDRKPSDLAGALAGRGVVITNVVYTGSNNAAGVFCSGVTAVGFDNGIVLTSGSATNVLPPNNSASTTTINNTPGDTDLDLLIPGFETHDAAVLEFDFIPAGNTAQFEYVFGSEEYNEFVGSSFNDVFGFYVNGVNYALLPGTTIPVAINNVNNGNSAGISAGPCTNCAFYVDNMATPSPRATQLDGLTTILVMIAPVNAGTLNHMKIAIADAGDFALDSAVFIRAGSLTSGGTGSCVTRDARFWFTHPEPTQSNCANLKDALAAEMLVGCGTVNLGFMDLPSMYVNDDNVKDAEDATLESLGFYWRPRQRTGELAGTQSQDLTASTLCRQRKLLSRELIAAIANVRLLGTDPSLCPYSNGGILTNFPSTLLDDARAAAAGDDIQAIQAATALLKKFNNSGRTNNFQFGIVECSPVQTSVLRKESRDPTLTTTCPGINDTCTAAEGLYFKENTNDLVFSRAKLSRTANLTRYTDTLPSPSCGAGGADATWKISPTVGRAGRQFTVDTLGSNFDTILSVYSGDCSNLTQIACSDDGSNTQSRLTFATDGTNTYTIVVEGKDGALGNIKLHVTSP